MLIYYRATHTLSAGSLEYSYNIVHTTQALGKTVKSVQVSLPHYKCSLVTSGTGVLVVKHDETRYAGEVCVCNIAYIFYWTLKWYINIKSFPKVDLAGFWIINLLGTFFSGFVNFLFNS